MRLEIFARLSQTAIRDGHSRCLRAWTFLRGLKQNTSGWVEYEDARDAWPQSEWNLKQTLNLGDETWWRWDRKKNRIYLFSAENVALEIGAELGDPSYVDSEKISTLKSFKAHAYAAFFVKPRTISRKTLCTLYGVTLPTLLKWEKITGIEVENNVASCDLSLDIEGIPSPTKQKGVWISGNKIYWQMSNTYFTRDLEFAPRHYRDDKKIRHALDMERSFCRIYYDSRTAAHKALSQKKTDIAYIKTMERKRGKRLWNLCLSPSYS